MKTRQDLKVLNLRRKLKEHKAQLINKVKDIQYLRDLINFLDNNKEIIKKNDNMINFIQYFEDFKARSEPEVKPYKVTQYKTAEIQQTRNGEINEVKILFTGSSNIDDQKELFTELQNKKMIEPKSILILFTGK